MAFNPFNQGIYNSTPPTLTSGQESQEQLDVNGNVKVAVQGNPADNVAEWGGTAVSPPPAASTPPAGSEVAPVVRTIVRKATTLLNPASIAASTTYQSAWVDSQANGSNSLFLTTNFPSAGFSSNALQIQQSDDQTNIFSSVFTPIVGTLQTVTASFTHRYWRIAFVNGATIQTAPLITVTESTAVPQSTVLGNNGSTFAQTHTAVGNNNPLTVGLSTSAAGDGVSAELPVMLDTNGGNPFYGALGAAGYAVTGNPASGSNAVALRTPNKFFTIAAVAVTAGTPVAIWTPAAGKKFRLMGYALSLSVAGSVILDDSATEMIRTPLMAAGAGQPSPPMGNGILSAAANNVLKADVSASGSVSGFVFGTEE